MSGLLLWIVRSVIRDT